VVNLRVAGLGRMREVAPFRAKAAGDVAAAIVGRQQVYFGKTWSETPLYDRDKLGEGATFEGPAIIQQYDSTTLVLPGQRVRVDRCGNLLIETNAGRRQEAA